MFTKEKIILWIEKIFPFFLLGQVLIDLLTTLFVHGMNLSISFGMIVRFLFLAIAVIYIILKKEKINKILLLALIAVNIYQIVYLFFNVMNFNFFMNMRYYLRTAYYAVMILFLWSYKEKMNVKNILSIIEINILIIIVTFLIANITHTNMLMYDSNMVGSSGWFSSGNEISSIMAILSFLTLYTFLNKPNVLHFSVFLGTIYVLISMGTKTSLVVLILLLVIAFVCLIVQVVKNKRMISYFSIYFILLIGVVILYPQFPAVKNVQFLNEVQKENNYKNNFMENQNVPKEIEENRYKFQKAMDDNSYLSSLKLSVSMDKEYNLSLNVNGYFYPKYFDFSHPKYMVKKLVLHNTNETFTFTLKDTYNRHVSEFSVKDYNSDFSGLSGKFNINDLSSNSSYRVTVVIEIDGIIKQYEIKDQLFVEQGNFILKWENNQLSINKELATSALMKNSGCEVSDLDIPLLSGRFKRANEFVQCNENYKPYHVVFGSGYIHNFISENGFEMDMVEVFITFGLLGFIIYFVITFKMAFDLFIIVIKNPKLLFKNYRFLLLLSVLIGFGLSIIVGHTILTPSSAIYLSLLLFIVYLETKGEQHEK